MSLPEPPLHGYHRIWHTKPILRAVYDDFAVRLARHRRPGPTLEIGAGSATTPTSQAPRLSTDIQFAPWLDLVADAQALPFAEASFDNITMIDVLHHLAYPDRLFTEAQRVLRDGGRLLFLEPAMTGMSRPLYGLVHRERVDTTVDPFASTPQCSPNDPYDANMAIPTLLVTRYRRQLQDRHPEFRLIALEWFAVLVYPLSGGFQPWSLIPVRWARCLLNVDDWIARRLGRWLATRLLAVLERQPRGAPSTTERPSW